MAREKEVISTTQQLANAVGFTHLQSRSGSGPKKKGKSQIHPATRTFQVQSLVLSLCVHPLTQSELSAQGDRGVGLSMQVCLFYSN